jgi:hypothetical protein
MSHLPLAPGSVRTRTARVHERDVFALDRAPGTGRGVALALDRIARARARWGDGLGAGALGAGAPEGDRRGFAHRVAVATDAVPMGRGGVEEAAARDGQVIRRGTSGRAVESAPPRSPASRAGAEAPGSEAKD